MNEIKKKIRKLVRKALCEIGGSIQNHKLTSRHNLEEDKADEIYKDSLDNMLKPWKDISSKFPDYNYPDGPDTDKAVNYILDNMKKKYGKEYLEKDWEKISNKLKSKIHGGITE